METVYTTGTGNRYVAYPYQSIVELNNQQLTNQDVKGFLKYVNMERVKVKLSNRRTMRRWGTAWPAEERFTLYRHSVWVFIHELSHIAAGPGNGHNRVFGSSCTRMIMKWFKYKSSPSAEPFDTKDARFTVTLRKKQKILDKILEDD